LIEIREPAAQIKGMGPIGDVNEQKSSQNMRKLSFKEITILINCCCFRWDIPVELRVIIRRYFQSKPLDDVSIRQALKMWFTREERKSFIDSDDEDEEEDADSDEESDSEGEDEEADGEDQEEYLDVEDEDANRTVPAKPCPKHSASRKGPMLDDIWSYHSLGYFTSH
jgi:hypothetical protein